MRAKARKHPGIRHPIERGFDTTPSMPHDGRMPLETLLPPPGSRVRITQQIPRSNGAPWSSRVEGVLRRYQQSKTGSWFAHAKEDRLWLDRLEITLDDGEITILNLDQYSVIEQLDSPASEPLTSSADTA